MSGEHRHFYDGNANPEFGVSLVQLQDMHNSDNATASLNEFGGIQRLSEALASHSERGLSDAEEHNDFEKRKKQFGENKFPDPKMPSFISLLFEALKDEMLIILMIAAIVSLVLGVAFPPPGSSRVEGSIEGLAILGAIAIVSFVQAGNNWYQERQFQKLNKIKQDVDIRVIRNGENREVSIHKLLAGDVVILESGNQIPADGFYIAGFNTTTDESGMTGESAAVKKGDSNRRMLSGTYVLTGNCTMMITCVGVSSQWGQALAELDEAAERRETPLQEKLGLLARYIGFVGVGVATVIFIVLCIYYIVDSVQLADGEWEAESLTTILQNFIIAVTIVVVAVPEGLPLAVTMALAYSLMKMRADKCLVRYLPACETMGGATQICSDKTGTLTQNRMTVVTGQVAGSKFDRPVIDGLDPHVHHMLTEGIARNSTADLKAPATPGGFPVYVGDPSECALLSWINKLNVDYADIRANGPEMVQQFPFSSARKRMSSILPISEGHGYRMYTKGAPEVILARCTSKIDQHANVSALDKREIKELGEFVEEMASRGLRTMALAYRDFEVFDVSENYSEESGDEPPEMKLTLIGIVGIEDPVRPEVPAAVQTCINAGIRVRMVTGDSPLTAASIARQCNILQGDDIVVEGPQFSRMSDEEIDRLLPKLAVLARCAPADKIRLVKRLIAATELVAVTGDGTNDAAALRGAHIGLAMGGGTEVARDASDIIILDDNFSSIVKAVMWGRSVFDNIRKFLQFQLTVNVAAMAIAALGALAGLEPLNAVQLLWVNLIMDSLGALALATEAPTPALLERPPKNISHPKYSLISPEMWKMIIGQSIFQIAVLYGGLFLIPFVLNTDTYTVSEIEVNTLVFNSFIFCQLFNLVACRKVNPKEYNVFQGFFTNWAFHAVLLMELIIQVLLVGFNYNDALTDSGEPARLFGWLEWIGAIFGTCGLNIFQWLACIAVGFVGFIWALLLRFIPTPAEKIWKGEIPVEKEADEETPLFDKAKF